MTAGRLLAVLAILVCSAAQAAEFRIDGDTLYLDGRIQAGDEHTIAQYLDSTSEVKRISINSPGGELVVGIKIGEMVRKRGLTTSVEAGEREAASAAAFIFMGGVEREVKGSRGVGVHAFYTPQTELRRMIKQKSGEELLQTLNEFERRAQEGTMAVAEFVTRMIGDTRIVQAAVRTGSDAMVWPEAKTLKEWKVVTKVVTFTPEEQPDLEWAIGEVVADLVGWLEPARLEALTPSERELLELHLADDLRMAQLREEVESALLRLTAPSKSVARTRVVVPIVDAVVRAVRQRAAQAQEERDG